MLITSNVNFHWPITLLIFPMYRRWIAHFMETLEQLIDQTSELSYFEWRMRGDVSLLRLVIRVTINKLYFVPEWLVSGVVGMLWNGGGLRTGESNVSIVSFYCYSPRWIITTFSMDKKLFERWNYDIMISLNLLFRTLLWFFLYQDMEGNIDWLDSTAAVISLSSSYLMQIF